MQSLVKLHYLEIENSGRTPIFRGNSMFNNRALKFKFQCSTKIQYVKKIKLKRIFNIQLDIQCSMITNNSLAIQRQLSGYSTATQEYMNNNKFLYD